MELRRSMSMHLLALNIIGALLVLAGIGLVAMNARGQIVYRAAASRHGGEVADMRTSTQLPAGQHGYMVRLVGTPRVVEPPRDPQFNQRVDTSVLTRHVEMFQWREVRVGSDVHYEMDWVDHPLDAQAFEDPHGHANPGSFPIAGQRFDAGLVQMGGFRLGRTLLHALPGSAPVKPDPAALPANLAASFSAYGRYLTTSTQAADPQLGDLRVSWDQVPLQPMTVVARVDGDRLLAATGAADGKGYEVQIGDVPLLALFPDLPVPPDFAPGWRLLAVLLAGFGAFALLSAHPRRKDPLLALALGTTAVAAVASMLWLGNDGRMACAWLLLAVLGVTITGWRLRRRRVRREP